MLMSQNQLFGAINWMSFFLKFQTSSRYWTMNYHFVLFQGYEGSLLKVTSKNGKTASPVGFVTFSSRASAEAAKQDLQVGYQIATLPRYLPQLRLWLLGSLCHHLPSHCYFHPPTCHNFKLLLIKKIFLQILSVIKNHQTDKLIKTESVPQTSIY